MPVIDSNLALSWEMVQEGVMRRSEAEEGEEEEEEEEALEVEWEVMRRGTSLAVVMDCGMAV